MSPAVDLNADVGEYGDWSSPEALRERELFSVVTTVHVACGGHAGSPEIMRRLVELCRAAGVVVGAHPSYPDWEGFGRRALARRPEDVFGDVTEQLRVLGRVAGECGGRIRSVKAHGALYHRMAVDLPGARAVAGAAAAFDPEVTLVVPATPVARRAALDAGLPVAVEGFCDRTYRGDSTLVPRSEPGAVIDDPEVAAAQAVALATGVPFPSVDGRPVVVSCQTLCLHGDNPRGAELARAVRQALEEASVAVRPFVADP